MSKKKLLITLNYDQDTPINLIKPHSVIFLNNLKNKISPSLFLSLKPKTNSI